MESLPTLAALMPEWQFALGDHLNQVIPFLIPSDQQAESYPCTHAHTCGCRHHIYYHSAEDILALCDCEDNACEPIHLKPADLMLYRIHMPHLAEAICQTLALATVTPTELGHRTWRIGSWSDTQTPVFFHTAQGPADFLEEIEHIHSRISAPFIMTTPTRRPCSAAVQGMLNRHSLAHIALGDTINVDAEGRFKLAHSIEPALQAITRLSPAGAALQKSLNKIDRTMQSILSEVHNPAVSDAQPCSDSTAIQLFALVKQLESESKWRKAPILQVFRLYCLESLTAEQIARRCACAKSLVILRLRQLRQKLGRNPAELRQYSSHFEAITNSLSDTRAGKIRPDRAFSEPENEEWEGT